MNDSINIQGRADKVKRQNIIEMAVSFSAMGRVFEKGSTEKIKTKIEDCLEDFLKLNSKQDYSNKHIEFCEWFTRNIKTAEKQKNGVLIKNTQYASWGQAAKVIDIVLKVCIYYCELPSYEASLKILPWLNGAIDTQILTDLKTRHNSSIFLTTFTIESIDRSKYGELQKMIYSDIESKYNGSIFPVQYDDIIWRELNR